MTGTTGTRTRTTGQVRSAGASRGGGRPVPGAEPDRARPARTYDDVRTQDCRGGRASSAAEERPGGPEAAATTPAPVAARAAARYFVLRAARWLAAERGVEQFLDIGSGVPAEPALHRAVRAVSPEAKVVHCDADPLALRHARAALREEGDGSGDMRTAYVHADVTDPESILDAPGLSDTIDLGHPVALSLDGVLHSVEDEEGPYDVVRMLLGALPAGSHLVLTHAAADLGCEAGGERTRAGRAARGPGRSPLRPRTRREVARFFNGLELAEPGLVLPHRWRPDADAIAQPAGADVACYAGVARKP